MKNKVHIRFINKESDEKLLQALKSHDFDVDFNPDKDYIELKSLIEPTIVLNFLSSIDWKTIIELIGIIIGLSEIAIKIKEWRSERGIRITIDKEFRNITIVYTKHSDIRIKIER